jgi:hypothetical protein
VIRSPEIDWLKVDSAAVKAMLAAIGAGDHPIGAMQFEYRRQEIEEDIARLEQALARADRFEFIIKGR